MSSTAPTWRLLDTPPARGAWNMAVDAALLDSVRQGSAPVLRFYRWSPRCLSLGRNQPARGHYDLAALRASGTEVVRRSTGGRAVLHDRELTYSAIFPEGLLGSPREGYAAVNRALVAGVRRLGVPAVLQPRTGRRAASPSLAPCFRDPAEGEVTAAGRKLVGSAQYREKGTVLQHGSLLLEGDQAEVRGWLVDPPAPDPADAPATLAHFLAPLPTWEAVVGALAAGWEEALGVRLERSAPTPDERERTALAERRYDDAAWTWQK